MKSIFNRPALKGSSRGGFAFGKLLAFMIALGVVGGGAVPVGAVVVTVSDSTTCEPKAPTVACEAGH